MSFDVVPLRTVAFQLLFLLVAIAIEAYVLQRNLLLTPKQSIEYSTSINLLSTVIGWILFLSIEQLLPSQLNMMLISFVLFDQWSANIAFWIIMGAFITFFASLFIEVLGLIQLQKFIGTWVEPSAEPEVKVKYRFGERPVRQPRPIYSQANVILMANALSYSAISLILLLRLLAQGTFALIAS